MILALLRLFISSLLVLLILLPTALPYVAEAMPSPQEQLRKWLISNLVINAFFPYRGVDYPVIGKYEEPEIRVEQFDPESRTRIVRSMKFGEYLKKVQSGELKLGPLDFSFYVEVQGPRGTTREVRSLSVSATFSWTQLLFTGGTYISPGIFTVGTYISYSSIEPIRRSDSVADTYDYNFELTRPFFYDNPEYLYSYLQLTNLSSFTLPRGEGVYFVLGLREISPLDVLRVLLKDSRVAVNPELKGIFERALREDPLASSLRLEWEVEGPAYLTDAVIRSQRLPAPCGYYLLRYSPGVRTLEDVGRVKEEAEGNLSRGLFKFCTNFTTRILAPEGEGSKKLLKEVDVYPGSPRALLASSLVGLYLEPKATGQVKVKVKVSDARGGTLLTLQLTVTVGQDRYGGLNVVAHGYREDQRPLNPRIIEFESERTMSIRVKESGEGDYGSYRLKVSTTDDYLYYSKAVHFVIREDLGFQENRYSSHARGEGEVSIGGLLLNPLPPNGLIIMNDYRMTEREEESEIDRRKVRVVLSSMDCRYYNLHLLNGEEYADDRENIKSICGSISHYNEAEFILPRDRRENQRSTNTIELSLLSLSKAVEFYPLLGESRTERHGWRYSVDVEEIQFIGGRIYSARVPVRDIVTNTTVIAEVIVYTDGSYTRFRTESSSWSDVGVWRREFLRELYHRIYERGEGREAGQLEERPSLFLMPSKGLAFAGENITLTISAYGPRAGGASVKLSAELLSRNRIAVKVIPAEVKLDEAGNGFAKVVLPSFSQIANVFGRHVKQVLLLVNATDSRGEKATVGLPVYVSGHYLALYPRDLKIPLPDDPWQENVLKRMTTRELARASLEQPLTSSSVLSMYVDLLDEKGKRVKRLGYFGGDELDPILKPLEDIEPGRYRLAYNVTLRLPSGNYFELRVRDAGITIEVPEVRGEGLKVISAKFYVPADLLRKYESYAQILRGEDIKYARVLADQALLTSLARSVASLFAGQVMGDTGLSDVLRAMERGVVTLRPQVFLPSLGQEGSELETLNRIMNFNDPRFNFSLSALDNPNNYWSKLTKFVILQAEAIRTFKYTSGSALAVSRLVSLLAVLETFKGLFSFKKFWNKQNLFVKYSTKNTFSERTTQILSAIKIGALVTEGSAITILGLFGNNLVLNTIKEAIPGIDEVTAQALVALIFKVTRFAVAIFTADRVSEAIFEVLFLLISYFVAHLLNFLFNLLMSAVLLGEIMLKVPEVPWKQIAAAASPATFVMMFRKYLEFSWRMPSFEQAMGELFGVLRDKSPEEFWLTRQERHGVLVSASAAEPIEETFFKTADSYMLAETITSLALSIIRGLDGIIGKLMKTSMAFDHVLYTKLLEFLNMPVKVMVKDRLVTVGLSDVVPKLYIALVAMMTANFAVKFLWLPGFKNMMVRSQPDLLTSSALTLQLFLPAITFFVTASVPIRPSAAWAEGLEGLGLSAGGELSTAANRMERLGSSLLGSMKSNSFRAEEIEELLTLMDSTDLQLRRLVARSRGAASANLSIIQSEHYHDYLQMAELVSFLVAHPEWEPSPVVMESFKGLISRSSARLRAAEQLSRGELASRLPALIVMRNTDLYAESSEAGARIAVTLHNIGDEDAQVTVSAVAPGLQFSPKEVRVPARGSATVELRSGPAAKGAIVDVVASWRGGMTAERVLLDRPPRLYEARAGNMLVISDAPVEIGEQGIRVSGASLLQVIIDKAEPQRYVATSQGYLLRSGELRSGEMVVVGVLLPKEFQGTVALRSVKQEVKYVEGSGRTEVAQGVTASSDGDYRLRVSLMDQNPVSTPVEGERVKFLAIDVLWAGAGSVNVEVELSKLGIGGYRELKVYKYDANERKYKEVPFTAMEGKVILTLTPGDPIFAIAASGADPLASLPSVGGVPLLPLLLAALLAALVGAALVLRRRR
ncbi:MAG: hypothetical protein N3D79_02550 [Acidilobaceae archaeon]|nr:hypothetical protein [Acidilobaceae archaeon]